MTSDTDQDEYGNLRLDYLMMSLHNAVEETIQVYGEPFFSDFSFPPMIFIVDKDLEIHGGPLFWEEELDDGEKIAYPFTDTKEIADCVIDMAKDGWMLEGVKPIPAVLCAVSNDPTHRVKDITLNSRLFIVLDDKHILSRYEVQNNEVVASVNASLNDAVVSQMYRILNEIKEL